MPISDIAGASQAMRGGASAPSATWNSSGVRIEKMPTAYMPCSGLPVLFGVAEHGDAEQHGGQCGQRQSALTSQTLHRAVAVGKNKKALTGVRAFQLEASSGIEPL